MGIQALETTDILIIGAGPAGSVAASYLQRAGVQVTVVERSQFPRIVVGESLLPRSMDHFEEAGLLDALIAQGFEKKPGARFIRGNEICIFDFSQKFGTGWDWTWQAPRADFDYTLSQELLKIGVDLRFKHEVKAVDIQEDAAMVSLTNDNGKPYQIKAKFLIDCSGYGRVLPRMLGLDTPSKLSPHSAIFSHVKDSNRPDGVEGTQISFDILATEVWLWVIPFSNGNTSLGIVAPTDYINKLSENQDTRKALEMAIQKSDYYINRFGDTPFIFEPIHLKNYSAAVSAMYGSNYALTGNSAEFLDPVFSSGVCFATESGLLAAKLAAKQLKGEAVDWKVSYQDYMEHGIAVFTTYVKEWYTGNLQTLFFHQPENKDVKDRICAILAGYVWNEENNFVTKHHNIVKNMAHLIALQNETKK